MGKARDEGKKEREKSSENGSQGVAVLTYSAGRIAPPYLVVSILPPESFHVKNSQENR